MGNSTKPTLRSRSTARVLDAISEGPIWGLLNGDKSIFLNGTQLQNNGGSYNFRGVRTNERKGGANQDIIKGFRAAVNEINDGRKVEQGSPITFDVSDADIDAVLLKLRVNSLFENTNKGKMKSTSVELEIYRQPNGGSFTKVATVRIKGRTTSAYDRKRRIDLPEGGFPYTIRINRVTNNSSDPNKQNDTYLSSYTLITDLKLRYPYTAMVGIEIDAQKFGSQFPERVYEIGGRLIDYPSNYNPNTRVYTGVWNGTFTSGERCDNLAWVLWDLALAGRYGIGHAFTANNVDKWTLYKIAQYCDELVPDGNGGTEPRCTFNGVIETREDAAKLLDRLISATRGMIYWQSGSITFTNDAPVAVGETVKIVNTSNVINGEFHYSSTGKKARHTNVIVAWNDPGKLGEVNYEPVDRPDLVLKYGYRPIEIGLIGCTSRAQAHRAGEWLLDSEANETTMVSYRASMDHAADVRPGKFIDVYDPWYAGARMGGRIMDVNGAGTQIELDAPIDIASGTYTIRITLTDGTVAERTITNPVGTGQTTITLSSALPDLPIVGAVYGIVSNDVAPRRFRVVAGHKKTENIFEISAVFHDPTKYARIERSLTLAPPSYTVYDSTRLAQPSGLDITETKSDNGDEYAASAVLSWVPATDERVQRYGVQIFDADDQDWQLEIVTEGTSYSYEECPIGNLKFRVRSIADGYESSDYVESAVENIVGYPDPTPYTNLIVVGKFREMVLKFAENTDEKFKRARIWASQTNNVATATIIGYDRDTKFTHKDLGKKEKWYYWIDAQDKYLRNSAKYPATTAGIAGTTKPIDDDDTTDDAFAAPTNLVLAKVQDTDEDGPVKTFIYMTCTPPGWAGGKTKYEWEITVDGRTVVKKTGGPTYNWRVHKIGQQHDVRVRAVQGSGKEGAYTGIQSITPTKKTGSVPTPTGVDANAKPNGNRVKCDDPNIKDLHWVLFYSHSSNNSGAATLVEKRKALKWRDDDPPGSKGDTSYYWIRFIDKSDNISSFSSVATCVNRGVDDGDVDNSSLAAPTSLNLSKYQNRDDDGTIRTFILATWNAPGWATSKTDYEIEITVDGHTYIEKSGDTKHRIRVQITGQQYDIRVRGVKGVRNRGNYTGYQSITPSKKAAGSVPAVGSITITTTKKAEITIDWVDVDEDTYKDYHRTWIYRNTTGATPTIGVTSVYKKLTQGQYTDKKTTTGVTYYYWVVHKDRSGNFSGLAGPAAGTSGGNEVSTFADLSGYIASAQINSNTINSYQIGSGQVTTGNIATSNVTTGLLASNAASNSVSVYNAPQVAIGILSYSSIATVTLDITDFIEYQIGISFVNTGTIDRVYTLRVYRGATLILQKGFTVGAAEQFGSFVFMSSGGSGSTSFDFQLITTSSNDYVADRAAFVYGRKR